MKDIPKIELHLHLEGAAPPAFIRGLAAEKKTDLSRIFAEDGSYAFRDFRHFLKVYEAATSVLTTPDDYRRLTLAVLEGQAAQTAIYTEAFLSPAFCGGGDLGAWRDYLAAIRDAADTAESRDGVRLRGVVTAIRHLGPEAAKAAARCAAETADDWLVGFGMAGDEAVGAPGDFAWAFDCAREAGLGLTVHAGEWGGPDSVREALRDLRVSRIGHGVRAVEDPVLVDEIAEAGVVLEVCPGSNIALGLYADWPAHPIETLRAAGVAITVSTDDPPFFHTALDREYERLADAFGWSEDAFRDINKTAARASFADPATKIDLLKRLDATDD